MWPADVGSLIPVKAKPVQIFIYGLDKMRFGTLGVQILHAENNPTTRMSRKKPRQ